MMQKSAGILNTLGCISKIHVDRYMSAVVILWIYIIVRNTLWKRGICERAIARRKRRKSLAQWITFQIDILKLLRRSCNKTNVNASWKPQKAKETFNLHVLPQPAIRLAFSLFLFRLTILLALETIFITLELKLIFFMEFSVIKCILVIKFSMYMHRIVSWNNYLTIRYYYNNYF